VVSVALVVSGALPLTGSDSAYEVLKRTAPVMVFLVAITVVAELCQVAGLFDVVAVLAARVASGRTSLLFLGMIVIGALATIVLSLDTTAVLFTPVVLALAARLGLSPLPFAFAAVWLANTASLLLPISNLTNLLALNRLGLSPLQFASRMALPAVAALLVTVAVLIVIFRRQVVGHYRVPSLEFPGERLPLFASGAVCCLIVPALAAGLRVWAVALVAASVLAAVFVRHRPDVLRIDLVPWRLVISVVGLFMIVDVLGRIGLDAIVRSGIADGSSTVDLLRDTGVAALTANAVNNLPAYLSLEREVSPGHPHALLAVLIGVNVGPLLTIHGSLATLLWRERCRSAGVTVSTRQFVLYGFALVPLALVAATAALAIG
jgi:arsenical pump membrane protein